MSAKLLAYRYVPQGFEIVIDDPTLEMGRVWNLWFNTKLTDDPESWDDEIRLLNDMQSKLGDLGKDHRLVRAQMAEFCRVHPLFPRSIDLLCEQIGTARLSRPMSLGCEGRGLLRALGYHAPQNVDEIRKDTFAGYVRCLTKWLTQGSSESTFESKVFGFLGQPTNVKSSLVEKLLLTLNLNVASISALKKLTEDVCRETQAASPQRSGLRLRWLGWRLDTLPTTIRESFLRRMTATMRSAGTEGDACSGGESGPICECCCAMFIDAVLLCIGVSNEERSVLEEFSRFTQENILAYCLAINSWLQAVPAEPVTSVTTTHYIADDVAKQLGPRVHAALGEKDEVKEWLAACLLKTVKDSQRWHKRVELLDGFPQAVSWFREHLPT